MLKGARLVGSAGIVEALTWVMFTGSESAVSGCDLDVLWVEDVYAHCMDQTGEVEDPLMMKAEWVKLELREVEAWDSSDSHACYGNIYTGGKVGGGGGPVRYNGVGWVDGGGGAGVRIASIGGSGMAGCWSMQFSWQKR
ncbi:hypothetical protein BDK51DRAFT_47355 [Blyttiomyces helicus]|uniref:Uncharacterized protein n=1 Tax=Blyttiomyces helicus TaxID=388810 RepID=A0A4P9VXY5_9FUNG|nr:hypothetical protein BDK51DRAFT_47355 [Blyttiomyces helicus]|eukprot:RKO83805.1 hypothetical protein BDK51DRAFT_47355 [Blyttiomyces helicus]